LKAPPFNFSVKVLRVVRPKQNTVGSTFLGHHQQAQEEQEQKPQEAQFMSTFQLHGSPLVLASFRNSPNPQIRTQAIPAQTLPRGAAAFRGAAVLQVVPQ